MPSHPTSWVIDKYRSAHEPSHHWQLKKSFMLQHKETFSESELVGLAQTLANIEFMGCTYPPDTMKRVSELGREIVENFREGQRGKLQRTFVSGSDAANSKVNRLTGGVKRGQSEGTVSGSVKKMMTKYGNFVASSSEPESKATDVFILPPINTAKKVEYEAPEVIELDNESPKSMEPSSDFMGFCNNVIQNSKNSSSIRNGGNDRNSLFSMMKNSSENSEATNINMNSKKVNSESSERKQTDSDTPICFAFKTKGKCIKKKCSFRHESPVGKAPCKKDVTPPHKKVVDPLPSKSEFGRQFEGQKQIQHQRQRPFQQSSRISYSGGGRQPTQTLPIGVTLDTSQPFHRFIVVTLAYNPTEQVCSVLQRSGSFCRMPVNWDYHKTGVTTTCSVKVDGVVVSKAEAGSKEEARDQAVEMALETLRSQCYTIEVKEPYMSDGTKVDLMDVEVNTKVGGKAEALDSGNVGHKLLSMMGWGGGGLGKDETGRSEPVTATTVFGREGLGSVGATKNFKERIKKLVEEWIQSGSPYDLIFTTGFDNPQRAEMHQVARRFGLKSKSFGKGENRHLTICRKFDAMSLLDELLRSGGETMKYSLFPPIPPFEC